MLHYIIFKDYAGCGVEYYTLDYSRVSVAVKTFLFRRLLGTLNIVPKQRVVLPRQSLDLRFVATYRFVVIFVEINLSRAQPHYLALPVLWNLMYFLMTPKFTLLL